MFEDVWRKEKEENVKIRFTVEHVEAREKFVKILEKGRGKTPVEIIVSISRFIRPR